MKECRKFNFNNNEDLNKTLANYKIKSANNVHKVLESFAYNEFDIPNRIVALPMEGVDGINGAPSELTFRKYERASKGGYGIIWLEATAINSESMSNDNQLFINDDTLDSFIELNDLIKKSSLESAYKKEAYTILQLNHSGRYANKNGIENAQIATHKPILDERRNIECDRELVSDEYLDKLKDDYLKASILARKAGFNAVDIKSCHGYLLSELFTATEREGKYGGGFENRTRFILETIDMIRGCPDCEGLEITVRLNMVDNPNLINENIDNLDEILVETKKLISLLMEKGVNIISLSLGNPYYIPNVGKPSDLKVNEDIESPLISSVRIIKMISYLQKQFPDMIFVGLGYTWFRQFGGYIAEELINNNEVTFAGFGRQVLAYPDLPNDLLETGKLDPNKVCITCGMCSTLKANNYPSGCVVRDRKIYQKYLDELRSN